MKVFPIKSPFDGEQVVGVVPKPANFVDPHWRKRTNHFQGQSLTHTTLRSEQAGRSGRIAALAQMLSPGVIDGLVVDSSIGADGRQFIHVSTGQGIDANGEIVRVNVPLRVELGRISLYAPVALLEGSEETGEPGGELARKIGMDFELATSSLEGLPQAAMLVLQPVQVEADLEREGDPCESDDESYAYENWQLIDGCRLLLYTWPEEIISIPGHPLNLNWRNYLANGIFEYEKHLTAAEVPPWAKLGVPVALIGFDSDWNILFADRHAVVRSGGQRRRPTSILSDIGNRYLFQARFDQFNEHLLDTIDAIPTGEDVDSAAARHFRYLPPVGVLPNSFIDLTSHKHNFFPLSYHVEALAVPYEQLDLIVQDSAGLSSFDFNRADRVQALVPVPQVYFEPRILETETLDTEFDFTIQRFVEDRNNWLGRRLEIQRKSSLLNQVVRGEIIEYAQVDDDAVDIAELAAPFEAELVEHGTTWHFLKGETAPPSDWNQSTMDDSSWFSGQGGFGFVIAGVETELDDMPANYVSLFMRKRFNLADVDTQKSYRLEVLTNGGFVAYLNGSEISSHNLSTMAFDATADEEIEAEVRLFDLTDIGELMISGNNLLAFQAHVSSTTAEGFIFSPRLVETSFEADIEPDQYGIVVKTDESGEAEIVDGVPRYQVTEMDSLREYFMARTFKDKPEDDAKLIWAQDEVDRFDAIESTGIEDFIDFLQEKVNKTNDKIDFGFVRLQTDIYRLRQFMLGNEEATKLATSPVLAGIARGQTAVATREDIARVASILSSQAKKGNGNTGGETIAETETETEIEKEPPADIQLKNNQVFLSKGFEKIDRADFSRSNESTFNLVTESKEPINVLASEKAVSSGGQLFGDKTPGIREIEEQTAIVGSYDFFKNVTVGERLAQPVTKEAVDAGRATRLETIINIQDAGISMGGIKVPGFKVGGENVELPFGDINSSVLQGIKDGAHEDEVEDNEASRFNSSVLNLERSTALLRLVEGRVKTYRSMIERCKQSLTRLYATRTKLDKRLKIIEDELAEARHDVSVSRALKAEEQERIDGINLRRKTILDEQVPFLLYRRPRLSDTMLDAPVHQLTPDLSRAPLPVCDIGEDETPEEISAMMEVIREAPVKWFKLSSKVMERINRLPDIQSLLKSARLRASSRTTKHRLLTQQQGSLNKLAQSLNKTLLASHSLIMLQRRQTAAIDLPGFARFGWQESRKRAAEVVSLGDIVDGNHGRTGASSLAAAELEKITEVAACLYVKMAQTLPSIRLDWAERLSQYDAPFNLQNLYSLPRWNEIDFIERSEMQKLTDWLYSRIDSRYSDARNMVSELVRVCILLASHSPVNQIISGMVAEPAQVRVGSKIDIVANISRVRIGMNIAMMSGKNTLARARVADIVGGRVQAEIVSTLKANVMLEKNTKVQIGEPRVTGGSAYRQNRFLFKR